VRNFAVDPLLEMVATIGCDGTLVISSIEDEKVLAKHTKIAKQTTLNGVQSLSLAWSENGD
jgi:hypothetical protein